jgi:hypothetical protein
MSACVQKRGQPVKKLEPAAKPLGKNGFKYKPQYGLVIKCRDEAQQQRLYATLLGQGLKAKVVCV